MHRAASCWPICDHTAPTQFAERIEPSVESLTVLAWHVAADGNAPPSNPDGNAFKVFFVNERARSVELFWMAPNGDAKLYGTIEAGSNKTQQTRPGAVWMIADAESHEQLGHFVVDDRTARAIIPGAQVSSKSNP